MRKPMAVFEEERDMSEEMKELQKIASAALYDETISDEESDRLIDEYNSKTKYATLIHRGDIGHCPRLNK